jgi:hypothetical protein
MALGTRRFGREAAVVLAAMAAAIVVSIGIMR